MHIRLQTSVEFYIVIRFRPIDGYSFTSQIMFRPSETALILLLITAAVNSAADNAGSNRYGRMAESMIDMMNAFSSAYQKRGQGESASPRSPWPSSGGSWLPNSGTLSPWGMSPWSMGAGPWSQAGNMMPWSQWSPPGFSGGPQDPGAWTGRGMSAPPGTNLNGDWHGPSGEVLMVRNDRFRIYLSQDHYREGHLRIIDSQRLSMQDPSTGHEREYEYARHQEKLVLRDAAGNLLLFKKR